MTSSTRPTYGFSLLAATLLASCQIVATKNVQAPVQAWVEIASDGRPQVRVLSSGAICPKLEVDGEDLAMTVRVPPSVDFPLTTCEAPLKPGVRSVSVMNQALPVPTAEPQRILVVGDTGCRIKKLKTLTVVQNCNDPQKWPFAKIAAAGAKFHPDLVIHVGDYDYRETPCPDGNSFCTGSPWGDQWLTWESDFFRPALPLLRAAPWVMIRGNHENCERAGGGWTRLLDGHPFTSACVKAGQPFLFSSGLLQLAIIDSAEGLNLRASLDELASRPLGNAPVWLITHRPFLTEKADEETRKKTHLPPGLQRPGAVGMVLAGHVHAFSADEFSDGRPPEVITGNGGTALEKAPAAKTQGTTITAFENFGFLTIEAAAVSGAAPGQSRWILTEHDQDAQGVIECQLDQSPTTVSKLACRSLKP